MVGPNQKSVESCFESILTLIKKENLVKQRDFTEQKATKK